VELARTTANDTAYTNLKQPTDYGWEEEYILSEAQIIREASQLG
jgi:hypothetical protein